MGWLEDNKRALERNFDRPGIKKATARSTAFSELEIKVVLEDSVDKDEQKAIHRVVRKGLKKVVSQIDDTELRSGRQTSSISFTFLTLKSLGIEGGISKDTADTMRGAAYKAMDWADGDTIEDLGISRSKVRKYINKVFDKLLDDPEFVDSLKEKGISDREASKLGHDIYLKLSGHGGGGDMLRKFGLRRFMDKFARKHRRLETWSF